MYFSCDLLLPLQRKGVSLIKYHCVFFSNNVCKEGMSEAYGYTHSTWVRIKGFNLNRLACTFSSLFLPPSLNITSRYACYTHCIIQVTPLYNTGYLIMGHQPSERGFVCVWPSQLFSHPRTHTSHPHIRDSPLLPQPHIRLVVTKPPLSHGYTDRQQQ